MCRGSPWALGCAAGSAPRGDIALARAAAAAAAAAAAPAGDWYICICDKGGAVMGELPGDGGWKGENPSATAVLQGHSGQAFDRYRSMTYLQGECSNLHADEEKYVTFMQRLSSACSQLTPCRAAWQLYRAARERLAARPTR
jgi:hypothetical protein